METVPEPRITSADRLEDGIVVTFDDGKCAVYPSSLLRAMFPQAREVVENELGLPFPQPPHPPG